jgi:hypothetical protein
MSMTIEGRGFWPPSVPSAPSLALYAHAYRLRGWSLFPIGSETCVTRKAG